MKTPYRTRINQALQRASLFVGLLSICTLGWTQQVNNLVISQVYGGGGNAGATFRNDFVELYNPTSNAISLTNHSLQYASASGTTWTRVTLSGSVAANGYFLISLQSSGTSGDPLPTPNITSTAFNIATGGGKLILSNATATLSGSCPATNVVDRVGFGTANCFEGSAAGPAHTNTSSTLRLNNGCTDTNQNGSDLTTGAPNPRNGSTPKWYCYPSSFAITNITPASPSVQSGFGITVQAKNLNGNLSNVLANTSFNITNTGGGILSGTTSGIIPAGSSAVSLNGLVLSSPGTATLTVTRTGGDNLASATSSSFTLLTCTAPQITSTSSNAPVCAGNTLTLGVTATGSSPLSYAWTGSGTISNGNTANATVSNPASGNYNIVVSNGCGTVNQNLPVTVKPLPNAIFSGLEGPYCGDGAAVTLTPATPGGTFSGTGVSGSTFSPAVSGAGTFAVTYAVTVDDCSNSSARNVTVNAPPVVSCGGPYGAVCTNTGAIALNGSPAGGTWSGTGVSGNSFNPATAGAGTFTLTYSYTDGNGCSNSCTSNITVNPLPVVTCGGPYAPVCINGGAVSLTGSPAGGTWSGAGVSGNSFNPATAGAGTFTLTYSYTDGNGCSNSCTSSITVNAAPLVSCGGPYGPVCTNSGAIALNGSPAGGTWSGAGVEGSTFIPSAAGAGSWTLTYSYTDGNGCTGICTTTIAVNAPLVVSCGGPYGPVCTNSGAIALNGSPAGGTWSGAGVEGSSFIPGAAGAGTYTLTYTNGNGCAGSCTTSITVNAAPLVSCGGPYGPVCSNGEAIALNGSPAGGTWSGTGVEGSTFIPGAAGAGTFNLTYSYSDGNGCTGSCTANITVNAAPVLSCGGPYGPLCSNSGAITLNGSPADGTWSGTGVNAGGFDPAIAGAGTHAITYAYTDGNGCTNAPCTVTITVAEAVSLYEDADGDGSGDSNATPILGCAPLAGYATDNSDDCDNDPLKTMPGQCGCGVVETDTDSDGTADCNDGCPNDPDKANPGACGCGAVDADGDGDGYADCVDGCPNDPGKIAPGACGCGAADVDSDGDGALNCIDACPNDPNKTASAGTCGCGNPEPGAGCNDGNPNTINDVIGANCNCAGTPATPTYTLTLTTDAFGEQTSWEITPLSGGAALCTGSGYPSSTTTAVTCPLPNGNCYLLTVYDAMMDGMCCITGTGGYVLRGPNNERIIDAAANGIFTSSSSVALGFCTPVGTDRLTDSRCDRVDLLPNDFVQARPNAAVQATYGTGLQSDDGYQFWFFAPNGGYSRRVLVTHANSSNLFPTGPDRCSYVRLSSITTDPLPLNVLLNVRVRSLVNGTYAQFGPACRFKIDTGLNCPTTQLVATPGSTFSCGITGVLLNGSRTLYAVPVPGANRYQFEFSKPGYLRNISSPNSSLLLTVWNTMPLQINSTYNVRVRISYDGGLSYCPFGATCTVATANPYAGMAQEGGHDIGMAPTRALSLWPNPNTDGHVRLSMQGLGEGAHQVSIDLFDLLGARVRSERLNIDGEELNTVVDVPTGADRGVYVVHVTIDGDLHIERLLVQ